MVANVISLRREDPQIFRAVVALLLILVVDYFTRLQRPTQHLLGDDPVLAASVSHTVVKGDTPTQSIALRVPAFQSSSCPLFTRKGAQVVAVDEFRGARQLPATALTKVSGVSGSDSTIAVASPKSSFFLPHVRASLTVNLAATRQLRLYGTSLAQPRLAGAFSFVYRVTLGQLHGTTVYHGT